MLIQMQRSESLSISSTLLCIVLESFFAVRFVVEEQMSMTLVEDVDADFPSLWVQIISTRLG